LKYFILTIAIVLFAGIAYSQDLKAAKTLYDNGEMAKAKTTVDALLKGTEANNPSAWLLKHKIYLALSRTATYKNLPADIKWQGYQALLKARSLPKADEALIKDGGKLTDTYFTHINTYYTDFIADGSAQMNNKEFMAAHNSFKNAVSISTLFYNEKIITSPLDTLLVFYAGYTAMQAKDEANTEKYFKQLVDANASGTDIQIAYGWLCNYYLTIKKDNAVAKKVYDIGSKHYPSDEYLKSMNTSIAQASGNTENVFAVYEENISKGNATFTDYLGYGAELYDYLYVNKSTVNNAEAKEKRMEEVLTKALLLKNNSIETNYILGMHYSSKAIALNNTAKIAKNAAEKAEFKTKTDNLVNTSAMFLETAVQLFEVQKPTTVSKKEQQKNAITQLINLYKFLGNTSKQAAAEKKLATL
jgi:hypothetical protein